MMASREITVSVNIARSFLDLAEALAALRRIVHDQPWNSDAKEALAAVRRSVKRGLQKDKGREGLT